MVTLIRHQKPNNEIDSDRVMRLRGRLYGLQSARGTMSTGLVGLTRRGEFNCVIIRKYAFSLPTARQRAIFFAQIRAIAYSTRIIDDTGDISSYFSHK